MSRLHPGGALHAELEVLDASGAHTLELHADADTWRDAVATPFGPRDERRIAGWRLRWTMPPEQGSISQTYEAAGEDLDEVAKYVEGWLRRRAGESVVVTGVLRVTG